MRTTKIAFYTALSFFPLFIQAQENENDLRKTYRKSFESMKLTGNADYFFDRKVDLSKSEAFKKLGIDLAKLARTAGEHSLNENILLADLVVQGTVSGREYNTDKNAFYHTKFTITVNEVVKGNLSKSKIVVCLVSGAIGVDSYVNTSDEPSLYLGEKVLLCLTNVDIKGMKAAKDKGLLQKEINVDGTEFNLVDKYPIKSLYVFDRYNKKIGVLDEAKSTAKKIEDINDSKNFLSNLNSLNPKNNK